MSTTVVRPVIAQISQQWGQLEGYPQGVRNLNGWGGHPGTDYAAPNGAVIVSCGDGVVIYAGYASGFGYHTVAIWHSDLGVSSTYGHMMSNDVGYGQQVRAGQRIGLCDTQGYSTGPHLHFEIRPMNAAFGGNPPNIDSEAWLVLHLSGVLPNLPALTPADRTQIRRMQAILGVKQDGCWGPSTDFALDVLRWNLLTPPRKAVVNATVRNLQHDIYHFSAANVDGVWGPGTDAAFSLTRLCWLYK